VRVENQDTVSYSWKGAFRVLVDFLSPGFFPCQKNIIWPSRNVIPYQANSPEDHGGPDNWIGGAARFSRENGSQPKEG
jgi:hypothetical protein